MSAANLVNSVERFIFFYQEELAERRVSIETSSADFRTQGIIQRFFDSIAHFFLYHLNQDYHNFYERCLQVRRNLLSESVSSTPAMQSESRDARLGQKEISPELAFHQNFKGRQREIAHVSLAEEGESITFNPFYLSLLQAETKASTPSTVEDSIILSEVVSDVPSSSMIVETPELSSRAESHFLPVSDIDASIQRFLNNLRKAFNEHEQQEPGIYACPIQSVDELRDAVQRQEVGPPLIFTHACAEDQGPRDSMEDAWVFAEGEDWVLAGVFDGHGGGGVALTLRKRIASVFFKHLAASGQIREAFNQTFTEIHQGLSKALSQEQGSTAVVSVFNKINGIVYTATLGDSEANIYRLNAEGQLQSISLSCVRNWGSKKDMDRLVNMYQPPQKKLDACENEEERNRLIHEYRNGLKSKYTQKVADQGTKFLRVLPRGCGEGAMWVPSINVSRAVGDAAHRDDASGAGISEKPKITVYQIQPGDTVVLACDGLKDYVEEAEVVQQISTHPQEPQVLAQSLVNYAIQTKRARDNVTVLVIRAT